jgi:hypothetical protein
MPTYHGPCVPSARQIQRPAEMCSPLGSRRVWSDPIAVEQQTSEQVPTDTACILGNL